MKASVLVDSHGWIEYFSDGHLASKYAGYIESANSQDYITPSIILYEVYRMIKSAKSEAAALEAVAHIIEHTKIIPIGEMAAIHAAEISLNTKLPMADSIIKAVANEHSAKIITGDVHFKGIENVIFIE